MMMQVTRCYFTVLLNWQRYWQYFFGRMLIQELQFSYKIFMFNLKTHTQANIHQLKVNHSSTRKSCKMCSKVTIKTPEWSHWHRYGVFIVNLKQISHYFLVFLLLHFSSNSFLNNKFVLAYQFEFPILDNSFRLKALISEICSVSYFCVYSQIPGNHDFVWIIS